MKIFVTGASGYMGSAVVRDMLAHGHQVVGLARGDASAQAIAALGAQAQRGDPTDLDGLRRAARDADAVAHLAYDHDFGHMEQSRDEDAAAITALGDGPAGTGKPIVTTAATAFLTHDGSVATETIIRPDLPDSPRVSEKATAALIDRGVRAMVVRLSQVNGPNNHGFVAIFIDIVRAKRPGTIITQSPKKGSRCAISPARSAPGSDLQVRWITPEAAGDYYGWAAPFMQMDNPVASALTRAELGWMPIGPLLLEGLRDGDYFAVA